MSANSIDDTKTDAPNFARSRRKVDEAAEAAKEAGQSMAQDLTDQAGDMVDSAGDTALTLGETVRDVAASAVEEVKVRALHGAETLRRAATERAADVRDATAEAGEKIVDTLRTAADKTGATGYASRALNLAADGLSTAAQKLDGASVRSVAQDARDFARRNPATTVTLAALAGFALVRLMRAAPADHAKSERS
ncbi:MAG: hypothetical protein R3D63_08750 [Paracoccaceae bacterium]